MKPNKVLALILALAMLIAPMLIMKPVRAVPNPYYEVRPVAVSPLTDINASLNGLETPATPSPVGQNFIVEIHLLNGVAVSGVEVKFDFSNIATYATVITFEDFAGKTGGVLTGMILTTRDGFYTATEDPVNATQPPFNSTVGIPAKYWYAGGSATPWTGADGLVVKITFQIIKQPQSLSGEPDYYDILEIVFADYVGTGGLDATVQGTLHIDTAPPAYPARPHIYIDPASYFAANLGDVFPVDVMITADAFWDVAAFDITFTYDPTLISLQSCGPGDFLGGDVWGWNDTTVPGTVWAVFTKLSNPTPSGGTDSLLTMTFEVIYQSTTYPPLGCALALSHTDLVSWAHPERIYEPWLGSITAVDLPFDNQPSPPAVVYSHTTTDGHYTSPFLAPGPAIDLYDQYPFPYGGQGPNEHSDSFAPQALVCLHAKVTYGGDRVTNKLVVFEIHNANGDKITLLQNYTDWYGVATACFRIPMTDMTPGVWDPAIFGWWNVIATVELDQVTVNDTMAFQVGWLVQVLSVTPENAPYLKYTDVMNFTAVVQTIHEQPLWALISVDSYDIQGYPIGESAWWALINATRVAGNPGTTTGGIYTYPNIIQGIPTWARVGLASVTGYALTDWPRTGGTPYGPQAVPTNFQIKLS